jgi:heat shock protein HslJ
MSFMGRWVQFLDLNTQVGPGVRYVSEAPNRQGPGAWTNTGTAYYYQGLSEDGRLYISLHWPVRTDSLPETPLDIPEDIMEQSTNPETAEQYWEETRTTLNALAPADWEPDLLLLDEMIASLAFELKQPEADGEEEPETEEAAEAETEAETEEAEEEEPPIGGQDTLLKLVSFGPVGAEEVLLEGTQIVASVSDLQMTGVAGCNSFLADVELQEGYFTLGQMTVTQKECTEPAGIMEQETAFLAALQGTNGFEYEQRGSSAVVAAKLFYGLLDGTNGVMNFVAP